MADLSSFRPPPEPAHTSVVRHYEDLVAILKYLRESQEVIDRAFDQIASQIGFVFATTVPVTLVLEEGGKVESIALRGEHLKGTLFEKHLLPVLEERLKEIPSERENRIQKGTYEIYVIWYDALKLKLGSIIFRPPPEPAHSYVGGLAGNLADRLAGIVFRPPPEPAHWFDRGALISERDQVLIVALDEVYGELKLLERINSFRQLPAPEVC